LGLLGYLILKLPDTEIAKTSKTLETLRKQDETIDSPEIDPRILAQSQKWEPSRL